MSGRWWFVYLQSAAAAALLYLPFLYLKSFDLESILYLLALVVATFAIGIGIIGRRLLMKVWTTWKVIPALAMFWAVSISMFLGTEDLRPWARWIVESGRYKEAVLRQDPDPASGLRHSEWDGWGWAGMDTSVQLVYDPSDSLQYKLKHDQSGPYWELSAKTARVQRLGKGWSSLTLYTSEYWD